MKALRILLIALFIAIIPTSVFAATLSHDPNHTYVTVRPGGSADVPVTVSIKNMQSNSYTVKFLKAAEGSLPIEWITPKKNSTFIDRYSPSASTEYVVAVPKGTRPGLYSSKVYSKAVGAHDIAEWGNGMLIEVRVPGGCSSAPVVNVDSLSPAVIWPPNHSMEVVTVTGTISVEEGCSLFRARYSIVDEYGEYTGSGEFTVSDNGAFSVALPVEAWRTGQDMDGRIYKIKLSAESAGGVGMSDSLEAIVPHDKGTRASAK